jgi:rhodanese-related sulfurtransferase
MRRRQTPVVVLVVTAVVAFQVHFGWSDDSRVAHAAATQSPVVPAPPARAATITVDELKKLHASGAVLVVDVRPADIYRAGRIAGAVSVPLASLDDRTAELRALVRGRLIVTYCSCPGDHSSVAAAEQLAAKGIGPVKALAGGYPAWVVGGGRTEKG